MHDRAGLCFQEPKQSAPWYECLVIPLRFELLLSFMIPISLKVRFDLVFPVSRPTWLSWKRWSCCTFFGAMLRLCARTLTDTHSCLPWRLQGALFCQRRLHAMEACTHAGRLIIDR